jgi:uncharacterized caspase-like protein
MRDRFSIVVGLFLAILLAHTAILPVAAHAQSRIALVVGNSAYQKAPALPTPVSDATDVAQSLERLGFSVTRLTDATFEEFRRALLEFGRAARDAQMAVIYYSGHGLEMSGENWLIPVDAELRSDIDVDSETISLRSLMVGVSNAKDLGLVILDACRSNPFASTMQRTTRLRSVSRGLARVEPSDNVLVAFAAMDGSTAVDDSGRHSPFTEAILANLETPGLELNFLFRNVRDDVLTATQGRQQPFVYGSLSKQEIYLKAPEPASSEAPTGATADEIAWSFLKNTSDAATLRRFLDHFPASHHQAEIKVRVASLEQSALHSDTATLVSLVNASSPQTVSTSSADQEVARPFMKDTPDIEIAWDVLKDTSDAPVLRRFVDEFPAKHRRERVASLDEGTRGFTAAVGDCDRFASDPQDASRPSGVTGVDLGALNVTRAVVVCRQAVVDFPDDPRFEFQLCRALWKAGNIAEATEMCRAAAVASLSPACVAADYYADFLKKLKSKNASDDDKKSKAAAQKGQSQKGPSKKKRKIAKASGNAPPSEQEDSPPPSLQGPPAPLPVIVGPGLGPRGFGPPGFGPRGFGPRGFGPRGFGPRGFGPRRFGPPRFGRGGGPGPVGGAVPTTPR